MKTFTSLLFVIILLFASPSSAQQYCMLPGRTIYSSLQPGIINFKLNTINRTSGNVEKPMNQPSLVVTSDTTILERGKSYTVTIKHSRDSAFFPTARNNIRVWIDYNKDFDWDDAGETVITSDLQTYGTFTASFTVPANAPLGNTWLRATAKMSADAGHTLPTSCDTPPDPLDYHGEMEDYKVKIVAAAGIDDIDNSALFSLYPNPSAGKVAVAFVQISKEPLTIDLYDLTGKYIANLLTVPAQNALRYEFDLNRYAASGTTYFIKVSTPHASAYKTLIRTH